MQNCQVLPPAFALVEVVFRKNEVIKEILGAKDCNKQLRSNINNRY